MLNKTRYLSILLLFLPAAPACADLFVRDDIITAPTPDSFSVCFDHTCTSVSTASLTPDEWRNAIRPLQRPAATAAAERAAIAESIALLEAVVGRYTGTHRDRGRNLPGFGQPGQLDCIDESTNSTTYLRMLERDGLLRHHRVGKRSTRFGLFIGMPHTTAVVEEIGSARRYAVDSWFLDNGQPPFIAEIEQWKAGAAPDTR
ncbi:MAG: hypothetical protein HKM88_08865 [Halobacteria archaeon]|nr:hypothetical protein [Halobacteria archaeon]